MNIDFKATSIGFYGFGFESQAVLHFLAENNLHPYTNCQHLMVFDEKPFSPQALALLEKFREKLPMLQWFAGIEQRDLLNQTDLLFRSPGISPLNVFMAAYRQQGKQVHSQTQLFCNLCPVPILAITGSNGKTTTTYLIHHLLKSLVTTHQPEQQVWLCGNMGISGLSFLSQIKQGDWVVMELSSFQLQDLQYSFDLAAILNITPNHLDYHANLQEYQQAKWNLVRFQKPDGLTILNPGTPFLLKHSTEIASRVFFTGESPIDALISQAEINFITHPQNLQVAVLFAYLFARERLNLTSQQSEPVVIKALAEFRGLPHRLEYVGSINQVKFYNDSEATTPEAAQFAVEHFSPASALFLIGGIDKGVDFKPLARACIVRKMQVICYGRLAETFYAVFDQQLKELEEQKIITISDKNEAAARLIKMGSHFTEILEKACTLAKPGQNIVLSPAGSSFDMFKNVYDRGDTFRAWVQKRV